MRYSVNAGGKRIRPVLCLKFCEAVGGDLGKALDAACAIELLHTYTLIHDDLPCMDDDALRRGKPTNHIVFGECLAVLAGDALQAEAFNLLLSAPLDAERVTEMARVLSEAAGSRGVCRGQALDMQTENKDLSLTGLSDIHEAKTAALLVAAAKIGVLAGGGGERQLTAAAEYAKAVGLAFQIRDDVLDETSTPEQLGKPVGSDAAQNKTTFASLLGLPRCEELISEETGRAVRALSGAAFQNVDFFVRFAEMLAIREK
jgi:geranylgeranyl diphosphate synthase type II